MRQRQLAHTRQADGCQLAARRRSLTAPESAVLLFCMAAPCSNAIFSVCVVKSCQSTEEISHDARQAGLTLLTL